MCGIAGAISPTGFDPACLVPMADAIHHRGPDGRGYLVHSAGDGGPRKLDEMHAGDRANAGFAHLRLSIIDLSHASDQPMVHRSGEFALIYNGETYNYLELREQLEARGHEFTSTGDSEVVLNAYAEWGPDCVERMVGMWAMAILDLRTDTVFLSVDRFGIKPLYYTRAGDALFFASEIKALMTAPGVDPEPDEGTVRRYLLNGNVDESERTFFDGVKRLPGAHNASVPLADPSKVDPVRYWSLPAIGYAGSRERAADEFAELFRDSVKVHLRSDVPVGTCLSGGLDSSSIVCVAEDLRNSSEVAHYAHAGFGYVPEDQEVSERRWMQAVVDETSTEMTYVEVSPDRFRDSLVGIVRQQDEPFGSASVAAQWFVFDAARKAELKVMLDGQGADEVLGGYHSYLTLMGHTMLRKRQLWRYLRFARAHKKLLGVAPLPFKDILAILRPRLAIRRGGEEPPPPELAANLPSAAIISDEMLARTRREEVRFPAFDSLHEMLSTQVTSQGMSALLRYEDRNSMAHSIEARVPFLDHRLVEFAFALPDDYRIDGVKTKDVLRRSMAGTLPAAILERKDKIGFRAEPSATWQLVEDNREAFLANRTPYEESWFDPDGLRVILDGDARDANSEFLLWRALNVKLWVRHFWGERGRALLA